MGARAERAARERFPQRVLRRNLRRLARRVTSDEWQAGAEWYAVARREAETIARDSGVPLATAAGVITALSPRTAWSVNVRAAHNLVRYGTQEPGTLGSNYRRGLAVLAGDVDPLGWGVKMGAFYRNIMGDEDAVTVDVWAFRAAIGSPWADAAPVGRPEAYAVFVEAYRAVAAEFDATPAQLQAAVWVHYRHEAYAQRARDILHQAGE